MHFTPTATRQTKTSADLDNWPWLRLGECHALTHPHVKGQKSYSFAPMHWPPTISSNAVALACRQIVLADLNLWPRMGPSPPSPPRSSHGKGWKKWQLPKSIGRQVPACPQALKRLRVAGSCNSPHSVTPNWVISAGPLFYGSEKDDLGNQLVDK